MMRIEVKRFAEAMENRLQENDHKPGWKNAKLPLLFRRLREEVDELFDATLPIDEWEMNTEAIGKEAADVANFAMMIADISHALLTKRHK